MRLLSKMLSGYDVGGHVTPEVAEATGLAAGTPVVAGLVDVVASTVGAGSVWTLNQGDGTFSETGVEIEPLFGGAILWLDLDNDMERRKCV